MAKFKDTKRGYVAVCKQTDNLTETKIVFKKYYHYGQLRNGVLRNLHSAPLPVAAHP